MKKLVAAFLFLTVILSLASCGAKDNPEKQQTESTEPAETATVDEPSAEPASQASVTESETESVTESTTESTAKETTTVNHNSEPQYIQAVKTAYNKIKAERDADGGSDSPITAYMTDLNGDGYKDIIYQPYWFPFVMIYNNGSFVKCEIDDEVVGGSIFPSGEESGYFIDAEKGIIVIRYDGHTTGTITYRGAEASKIKGTKAERIWIEYYECPDDKFADEVANEEFELIGGAVDAEYNSKQYYPRIKDYNLVSYYDVCKEWDGSVI